VAENAVHTIFTYSIFFSDHCFRGQKQSVVFQNDVLVCTFLKNMKVFEVESPDKMSMYCYWHCVWGCQYIVLSPLCVNV